jgi:hypothetical protein
MEVKAMTGTEVEPDVVGDWLEAQPRLERRRRAGRAMAAVEVKRSLSSSATNDGGLSLVEALAFGPYANLMA